MKLMSLLNDKGSSAGQSNMAGANQHMTNSIKDIINMVDVYDLKLTIGHPNETLAKITHVRNLKLNNDVMLFDVLVIPEYTGLKKGRVLGTGSVFGGLYLFDKEYNKSTVANNSKLVSCFVSKEVWHCRLGHPANQVLKLLKGSLNLSNIDHEGPCEVCHKAKQTKGSFHLSENKSTVFGQLMHLDVWGSYKVINREGFKYFLTIVDDYSSPDDNEEGSSFRDGSVHQSGPSHSLDQPKVDEQIPTLGNKVEIVFLESLCCIQNSKAYQQRDSKNTISTLLPTINWVTNLIDKAAQLHWMFYMSWRYREIRTSWREPAILQKLDIENLSGDVIELTLWDEMAKNSQKAKYELMEKPVIIAVSSYKVIDYANTFQLTTSSATFYYLDPEIP
nr:ribonuclease H-like domain-containing protein [Tanacetum cinerariifolium]